MNDSRVNGYIGMRRQPYLINKAIAYYLTASILSSVVVQLNTLVDGIVVGQCVGTDAFSAINLYTPIGLVVTVFFSVFCAGAKLLAARSIGKRDLQKTSRIMSTAMAAMIILGVIGAVVTVLFHDGIADVVCRESASRGYFIDYLMIMGTCCIFTISCTYTGFSVDVDGRPRLSLLAHVVSAATNIGLDILLVGVLDLGVKGAAWASIAASCVSCIVCGTHYFSKRCSYWLRPVSLFSFKSLGNNVKYGIPLAVGSLVTVFVVFSLNTIIQKWQGADGLFAMSVCINMITIAVMLTGGLGSMVQTIGGFLKGRKDATGLRMLVGHCLFLLCVFTAFFVLAVWSFPGTFARLFGADTPRLIGYTSTSLRWFGCVFPGFLFCTFMVYVYLMSGRKVLASVTILIFLAMVVPFMQIWAVATGDARLWHSFLASSVASILVVIIIAEIIRYREKGLTHVTLIPLRQRYLLDLSVRSNQCSVGEAVAELRASLIPVISDENKVSGICSQVRDILLSVVQQGYDGGGKHFIDLSAMTKDDCLNISISHAGRQEDCIPDSNGYSPEIERRHMFGQNMIDLTWPD